MRHLGGALLIAAVVLAVFAPVHRFEYLNFDDDEYVTDNPFVRSGLSLANVEAAFTRARGGHYHPLTWISHMADVSWFGLTPGPAHLVNAGLHALTAALLFLLACRLRASPWQAAVVGLVFGLHPMRLESVAWIAERKDVLSLCFAVLVLHGWVSYARRPALGRYLLVTVLFVLGLLCKPTLVMLPILLLAFDAWPLGRVSWSPAVWAAWRPLVLEKLPLAALSLASVAVTATTQLREGALAGGPTLGLPDRVATAAVATLVYLGKFFWPAGLGIFYPLGRYAPGVGAGAVLALVAITALCWSWRRQQPALWFAWVWLVIAPLPVIGLVQFGGQAFADRWSYLPHLGLVVGLVFAVGTAGPAWLGSRARWVLGLSAVAACALWTSRQLPHWATSETIFRHTLAVAPDNFLAHTNLGNALDARGRLDEAARHYEEAARLNPTYPEALNNLGTLRARQGQMTVAEPLFRQALAIRPGLLLARYNLGLAASHLGRPLEALTEWLRVLAVDPGNVRARPSLRFVATRVLGPTCDQVARLPPPSAATVTAFEQARAAWRPLPEDAAIAGALANVSVCLAAPPASSRPR